MKRRKFFKNLGALAVGVVVTKRVVADEQSVEEVLEEAYKEVPEANFVENVFFRPQEYGLINTVEVTTPLTPANNGYLIGLTPTPRKYFDIHIPAKCTNRKTHSSVKIVDIKDGLCHIMCYSNRTRINGIKVGTRLVIGTCSFGPVMPIYRKNPCDNIEEKD